MPSTRIIIIEDEFFAADHLSDLVTELGHEVVGVFHSGEDFLEQTDWSYDAAIVDIFLSEKLNGLDVAARMKERNKPFIFLTANQDEATLKNAARLAPKAYISKPFKSNDVAAALQIINFSMPGKIEIRGVNGKEYLSPSDVLYIKSDGVYIEIFTFKGSIVQRKLLKDIVEELPDNFIRVHRSYLVNRDFIEKQSTKQITINGAHIPVSRSFREHL